jgi:hypothetical protein
MTLPTFELGASGHLDLDVDELPELEEFLVKKLRWLFQKLDGYAHPVLATGLARGADQLVANSALIVGWHLKAVLPCPQNIYITSSDFKRHPKAIDRFHNLLESCDGRVLELDWPPKVLDLDIRNQWEQAFRNQSQFIANKCDAVLALWDGQAVTAGGCGTSYVVDLCSKSSGENTLLEIVPVKRGRSTSHFNLKKLNWSQEIQQVINQLRKTT